MLTLVFSSFSFLTITFYAQGVSKADRLGRDGHLRLARWRESGALLGICLAAILPELLAAATGAPFAGFGIVFALAALAAFVAMRAEWDTRAIAPASGFRAVLADGLARRLLAVAFLNAAPVAVSSTLFLFFVESRLGAPGWEGPLLLVFFLSAAAAAPLWSRLAERIGARRALLIAMGVAIVAFACVPLLGTGDVAAFAVICVVSGAAVGADMTLLPALFAARMARVAGSGTEGFGLWSFVSKFTLAFAAVLLLPALEAAGFRAGADNPPAALSLLSLLYAAVPCVLKALAMAILALTPIEED
jgi:GPH family glycoside/pentoside/hexuronide:cation symporter